MNKITKQLNVLLTVSIIVSVLFAGGIPMIPIGAANEIYPVMILGIIFTGGGFFATPLLWVYYGELRGLYRVVVAVEKEHLYTVREIASQLSLDENHVRNTLTNCFRKGYFEGYLREGDEITTREGTLPGGKIRAAECPYCGAKFSYQGKNATCPYCGGVFTPEK